MFGKAKDFLLAEDRGVSPVIGVILMVAITVILAAVIATFVMNMGPSETQQPNAQWDWNNDGADEVTLAHTGGDAADPTNFVVEDNSSNSATLDEFKDFGGEMTASDSISINSSNYVIGGGSGGDPINDTFTLIWENPSNDQTQEVDTYSP